jgi:hypothetical protein
MLLRWGESASRTSATHQRRVWVNSNYLALFLGHLLSSRRLRQRRFSCRSDDGWSSVGPSAAGSSEVLLSPGGVGVREVGVVELARASELAHARAEVEGARGLLL